MARGLRSSLLAGIIAAISAGLDTLAAVPSAQQKSLFSEIAMASVPESRVNILQSLISFL